MESIIARQDVARRRPPAVRSPASPSGTPFFEGRGASPSRPVPGGPATFFQRTDPGRPAPRLRAGPRGRAPVILDQKPARRASPPRDRGPSPFARAAAALGKALRAGPRLAGSSARAASAAAGRAASRTASAFSTSATALRGAFFAGGKSARLAFETPSPLVTGRLALPAPQPAEPPRAKAGKPRRKARQEGPATAAPRPSEGPQYRAAATRARAWASRLHLPLPGRRALALAGAAVLALAALGGLVLAILPPAFPLPEGELLPPLAADADPASTLLLDYLSPEPLPADGSAPALPLPRVLSVSEHRVAPGESVSTIAKRYGLRADTIISYNGIKDVKSIRQGTALKIPNMDGVIHVVTRGESLAKVASSFKADLTLLADANDLGSAGLKVGQRLFIPGARLPDSVLRQAYGSSVAWPLRGPISSRFGIRADPFTGVRRFHSGVDIVANLDTPVKAASDGKVVDLGYNANYGNYIIMASQDGLQFLYGHLDAFCVTRGQSVPQGKVIAKSGNTGYSTGPHLHFGVYRNGTAIDPLKLVK